MTGFAIALIMLAGAQIAPGWSHVTPTDAGWTDVIRLSQNTAIRVRVPAGTVTGSFVSATPEAIVLRVNGHNVSIDRTSVTAVDQSNGKSHRGRNAGIGAFAGMGLGLIAYGLTCQPNCQSEGAPAWTVPMELIGVVAGAAAPNQDWHRVYRK